MKAFKAAAFVTIGAAFCTTAFFSFLLFYPYKTIEANLHPFPVLTERVKAGSSVKYTADVCRYVTIPAEVEPQLENGVIYFLPPFTGSARQGCNKNVIEIPIPEDIPDGRYILRLRVRYQVNPLRIIWKTFTTTQFEVYH